VNRWETCGNWEVDKEKTEALEYTNDGQVSPKGPVEPVN
jgi:hypothetical protein